jgi:hypothetical protein
MMRFNLKLPQLYQQIKLQLRLHWLDLAVVCVIIAVGAVLLWQRVQRKTEWLSVQVKVTHEDWWWAGLNPETWYTQNLTSDAGGFNSFGEKVIQVENVQTIDTGAGRNQVIIQAKLKVSYDPKRDQYIFGFQSIQVGKGLELDLGKQQIKGLVIAMDQQNIKPVERLVKLRIGSIDPTVAETFTAGLTAKTLTGDPIATIVKVKTYPTIEAHYSDIRNQVMTVPNPQLATVEAVMKLKLYQSGDQYLYADGSPVKIGSALTIQFPQVVFPAAEVMEWVN